MTPFLRRDIDHVISTRDRDAQGLDYAVQVILRSGQQISCWGRRVLFQQPSCWPETRKALSAPSIGFGRIDMLVDQQIEANIEAIRAGVCTVLSRVERLSVLAAAETDMLEFWLAEHEQECVFRDVWNYGSERIEREGR